MPGRLSEVLLRDLRVVDSHIAVIEVGAEWAAKFAATRRCMLHLVLEGAAWLLADDAPPRRLAAGDTALLFYGDAHRIGASRAAAQTSAIQLDGPAAEAPGLIRAGEPPAQALLMSCALELAYVSPSAFAIRAAPKIWPMRQTATADQGRALAGDVSQWREALDGPGATAFASSLASLLLVHSLRDMVRHTWHEQAMEVRAPVTRWLAAAIQAIHLQPDRSWTVAGLAHEVGMSRTRFAATFTAHIGTSPLAYLTKVRMTRAAQLLELETIPIAEVARRCGYPVQTSFARAFTSFHGATPAAFRGRDGRHEKTP